MPGSYNRHLDEFGVCTDSSHSGIEMMDLEVEDDYGRYHVEQVPACAICFGLKV